MCFKKCNYPPHDSSSHLACQKRNKKRLKRSISPVLSEVEASPTPTVAAMTMTPIKKIPQLTQCFVAQPQMVQLDMLSSGGIGEKHIVAG